MARRGTCVLVATLIAGSVAVSAGSGIAASAPEQTTVVPMTTILRACDFSAAEHTLRMGNAHAMSFVHPATAGSVTVDVQLETAVPNTDYYVKVFTTPRVSWDCGVAPILMHTDGVGAATVTIHTPVDSGTAGVWASVERPDPYSQQPAEVYTSIFIAKV